MASTKTTLEMFSNHLDESLGVRPQETRPKLSPVPAGKDVGRKPDRQFGTLDITQIIPDPDQPRTEFSDDGIERLADSIRERGQLNPIRVRWSGEHSKWVIISGERRWRATMAAGLPRILCYFHDDDLTTSEILEEQIIENCLRENLQPMEEARAFQTLMELNRYNAKQLAEVLRVSPSKVSRTLALLKLPTDIQLKVDSGELAARSAYELSKLDNVTTQRAIATEDGRSLTHKQIGSAVRKRSGKPRSAPRGTRQTFVTEAGWKVIVSSKRHGTYDDVEQALAESLEEVRHRIKNHATLF